MRPDDEELAVPGWDDAGDAEEALFLAGGHLSEGAAHAFVDGALEEADAARVIAHVAGCARCAGVLAEARGLAAAATRILGALDDVPGGVVPAARPEVAASAPVAADEFAPAPRAAGQALGAPASAERDVVSVAAARRRRTRWTGWPARAAAGLLLVAGVGSAAWQASRPGEREEVVALDAEAAPAAARRVGVPAPAMAAPAVAAAPITPADSVAAVVRADERAAQTRRPPSGPSAEPSVAAGMPVFRDAPPADLAAAPPPPPAPPSAAPAPAPAPSAPDVAAAAAAAPPPPPPAATLKQAAPLAGAAEASDADATAGPAVQVAGCYEVRVAGGAAGGVPSGPVRLEADRAVARRSRARRRAAPGSASEAPAAEADAGGAPATGSVIAGQTAAGRWRVDRGALVLRLGDGAEVVLRPRGSDWAGAGVTLTRAVGGSCDPAR